jgi:hypothetical protein
MNPISISSGSGAAALALVVLVAMRDLGREMDRAAIYTLRLAARFDAACDLSIRF